MCSHFDHGAPVRKAFEAFLAAAPSTGQPSDALLQEHAALLCKAYCATFPKKKLGFLFDERGELLPSRRRTGNKRSRGGS